MLPSTLPQTLHEDESERRSRLEPVEPIPSPASGFICAEWRVREEGPILDFNTMRRRQLVNRCDLPEGHEGDHVDQVLLVNWPKSDPIPSPVEAAKDEHPFTRLGNLPLESWETVEAAKCPQCGNDKDNPREDSIERMLVCNHSFHAEPVEAAQREMIRERLKDRIPAKDAEWDFVQRFESDLEPVEAPCQHVVMTNFCVKCGVGPLEPVEAVSTTPKEEILDIANMTYGEFRSECEKRKIATPPFLLWAAIASIAKSRSEQSTPLPQQEPCSVGWGYGDKMVYCMLTEGHSKPCVFPESPLPSISALPQQEEPDICGYKGSYGTDSYMCRREPNHKEPHYFSHAPNKEREFCEWMISFNDDPKFVKKFTTLFIDACNERVAKGGYPQYVKYTPLLGQDEPAPEKTNFSAETWRTIAIDWEKVATQALTSLAAARRQEKIDTHVMELQAKRIESLKQTIAGFNTGGFADADAVLNKYLETVEKLAAAQKKLAVIFDSAVYSDSLGVHGSDFSVCRWCGGGSSPGKGDFEHNDGCLMDDDLLEQKVKEVWEEVPQLEAELAEAQKRIEALEKELGR